MQWLQNLKQLNVNNINNVKHVNGPPLRNKKREHYNRKTYVMCLKASKDLYKSIHTLEEGLPTWHKHYYRSPKYFEQLKNYFHE